MSVSPSFRNPNENRLLAILPTEEYKRLLPHMESIFLPLKQILYQMNEPIEYVYFPKNGIVSLVTIMEDGATAEIATVGNEGMIGLPVFLGTDQIPGQAFSQIPGESMRMKAEEFKTFVTPDSPLYKLLQRYTQTLFNQVAQSAACNCLHCIEKRFCRWLLMTHDRVQSDEFLLTQEFLAQMLGVRRASVSQVASIFQKAGIISYSRGQMRILDRTGLQAASCECYAKVKQEFERLLGNN
ncbi:Crp/Fnr family transcriptional regulator [Brasilonema bromeliae SPC951]|uniref:Crp/Fnr family transcriptional regulator n=1 Tax=Brasilonema bromeliae SPC951 TaxID=385972 RepID=A0ABX1PBI0_9CYAN|nr:Crp/Fnr family transcriptional regulator [Brasilonema bromeliae SPC951]